MENKCGGRGCGTTIVLPNDGIVNDIHSRMFRVGYDIQTLLPFSYSKVDKNEETPSVKEYTKTSRTVRILHGGLGSLPYNAIAKRSKLGIVFKCRYNFYVN